jgi:copper chaperone CopZ
MAAQQRIVVKKLKTGCMKLIMLTLMLCVGMVSTGQVTKVSLQASGLTCSMCSKAVKTALEEVPFVEKVQVDIKNQKYNLTFKEGANVEIDELGKAVEDAGFSVASLVVTANVNNETLEKDHHLKIGNSYFHFLNASGQQINGSTNFNIVDKKFVSEKEFKKYSGLTKMKCVETGKSEPCCLSDELTKETRIYHAIL